MKYINLLTRGYSLSNCGEPPEERIHGISMEWISRSPHVFLWADKIFVPKDDFDSVVNNRFSDSLQSESYNMLFESFRKEKVITTFEPRDYTCPEIQELISNQVDDDESRWGGKTEIDEVTHKQDYSNIKIGPITICPFRLDTIYSTLYFARELDAGVLFDSFESQICNFRFSEASSANKGPAFEEIFTSIFPRIDVISDYAQHLNHPNHNCNNCASTDECKSKCIEQTEQRIGQVLDLRNRDEVIQTRKVLLRVINESYDKDKSELKDIVNGFKAEMRECKKRMQLTFPKLERWLGVSTAISTPIALLGDCYNNGIISLAAASVAAPSIIAGGSIDYLKSKYQWVNFVDSLQKEEIK